MTAGSTCALPGCSKPPFPSPDRTEPHLACGNLHHQLLMAGRFHPTLPHPHQEILDRNSGGLCALPSCWDAPYPGHSWCSKTHYLNWLFAFTSRLLPDQICKLPGCTRHVFVDANSKCSKFCGWRHCQKFVMRFALQRQHLEQLPPQDQQPHLPQQESLPSPSSSVESKCGHVPSVPLLVQTLRDYASHRSSPKNILVDEDFFSKHPWEACTEGHTCWFLVRCEYTSKGKRVMTTKEGYHWKQQGRPVSKNSDYALKYFTYKKQKGKRNGGLEHHDKCKYYMEEYTTEDVRDFALVKLRKNSNVAHRKKLKGQPNDGGKQFATEINDDDCFQNSGVSNGSNEVAVDSCISGLPPPDESWKADNWDTMIDSQWISNWDSMIDIQAINIVNGDNRSMHTPCGMTPIF